MKKIANNIALFAIILFVFYSNSFAQTSSRTAILKDKVKKANDVVISLKHKSDILKREMSYRVIFPHQYNINKQKRYPVLYLLHGLTGNFKDWADKTKLADYVASKEMFIVMPDGHNSWYTDSIAVENDKYESYIIDELIPKIDKDFRTNSERSGRMIAGLSMGGYGSLKFGLKYPEKFILAGSFSGALRAAEFNGKDFTGWKALSDSLNRTFGDLKSKTREENNIFKLLESMSREDLKKLPYIYLDCGTEDNLIKQNRDFAKLLLEQKVPHEFRQLPGKHDWVYWDLQIKEFLQISDKYLVE